MADSQQQNSNPNEPQDLSPTGKQCLENSTNEQCDLSSNKLGPASSTDIEKPAINATDPQTLTYGKHRLPIKATSKPSLSRGIQRRKSKQILVTSARAESQVNNDRTEKVSSLQISGSTVGSTSRKNVSSKVKSRGNNVHAEEVSSSQTTKSAASSSSKRNAFPQVKSRVNNDQAEGASSSKTTGSTASLPSKINASPIVESRVNSNQAEKTSSSQVSQLATVSLYEGNTSPQVQLQEKASSSQAPESAAGSLCPEKSARSFRFSEEQLEILLEAYEKNKNPCYNTKMKLASELNAEYNQVHKWFYRRIKGPKKRPTEEAPRPPPQRWLRCKLWEQDLLEAEFKKNPYPTLKVQNEMSVKINLPAHEIVQWFKRRRKIEKKKRNQPPTEPTKHESD